MKLSAVTWFLSNRRITSGVSLNAESGSITADGGSRITRRASSDALLDESNADQINQPRRSLSVCRGHLTRLYKEMGLLFSNCGSQIEVLDRKCS